jgi:prevent-host-death family protein
MLQRRTWANAVCEITIREANQNFSQVIAAAERGETIIVTKNGRPVAKITPQSEDRASDPEWRAGFAALKKSLRSKRATGYSVGTITEDEKYGDDAA